MIENYGLSYIEELDYLNHLIYPEKRRPYTKNGQKCITDCKFPGDSLIHPYNNTKITEYNEPFCGTDSWYDPSSKRTLQHDSCNYTHTDLIAWSEIDSSNFIPLKQNECESLLVQMHNIRSWEDALKWEQSTLVNEVTRRRVVNCAWKAFAPDDVTSKEYELSIINKYHNLINNDWKDYVYNGLNTHFPSKLKKKEVINKINKIVSNKKLIKLIVNNFRKKKRLGWITLKYYDDQIKQFCVQEIKSIL